MSSEEFNQLFGKGESVYFINSFDEVAFVSLGNGDIKGKEKGEKEFSVKLPNTKFTEALLEHNAISKEEYDNY